LVIDANDMVSSQKVLSAVRSNWLYNAAGLLLSFCASILLVRALPPQLFAQYSAVLAIIAISTLVFDAGATSGMMRFLAEASQFEARGSFYRTMQRRRWMVAALMIALLIGVGPFYARATKFSSLADQPGIFIPVALIAASMMTRVLAHYGLLALFETRKALLWEQAFLVCRAVVLAVIAMLGGTLWHLVLGLLAVSLADAVSADIRLSRLIRHERGTLPPGFIKKAHGFGLLTILDKACAGLGSSGFLLLVLAPSHPAGQIAFLALAADLVGKLLAVTVMPMGNLVAPYLSQTDDDPAAQGLAAARVTKLSSLLYCFSIGAGALLLPWFVPVVYGNGYAGAAWIALLLLVPVAFENWVRGCCSPALLRNGRYRELMSVNAIQAVVTLVALFAVHRQPIEIAVLAVGTARVAVSALNLVAMGRIVPPGTFRVPLAGAAVAALACAAASMWSVAPLPAAGCAAAKAVTFAAIFYAGMRWLVFRDEDTLRLAHRVAGHRANRFTRLLPAMPLPEA
jgi:O-antigen/teichoic acid export membrane protein